MQSWLINSQESERFGTIVLWPWPLITDISWCVVQQPHIVLKLVYFWPLIDIFNPFDRGSNWKVIWRFALQVSLHMFFWPLFVKLTLIFDLRIAKWWKIRSGQLRIVIQLLWINCVFYLFVMTRISDKNMLLLSKYFAGSAIPWSKPNPERNGRLFDLGHVQREGYTGLDEIKYWKDSHFHVHM